MPAEPGDRGALASVALLLIAVAVLYGCLLRESGLHKLDKDAYLREFNLHDRRNGVTRRE